MLAFSLLNPTLPFSFSNVLFLELKVGLEPTTYALRVRRSAN